LAQKPHAEASATSEIWHLAGITFASANVPIMSERERQRIGLLLMSFLAAKTVLWLLVA
jgi:hypothetical protein